MVNAVNRLSAKVSDALLGAALLRPTVLREVGAWIPAGVFERPEDGALWQALQGLGRDAVDSRGFFRPDAVSAALDPQTRAYQSADRLNRLVGACPSTSTAHAAMYAGMTLESAISRVVEQDGQHLQYHAQAAEPGDVRIVLDQVERTDRHLDALARSWAAAPETVRSLLDTAPAEPSPAQTRADRRQRVDLHAEATTVASLLHQPRQMEEVKSWLQPGDFSDPELAAAFTAIATLVDRRAPVDPLTVAWQAQRQPGTQVSEQVMSELTIGGLPGAAAYAGEQVLSTAVLDRLDATGRHLRDLGRIPATPPTTLLDQAHTALEPAAADRDRIHTADREMAPAGPSDQEPAPAAASAQPHHNHEMEIDL